MKLAVHWTASTPLPLWTCVITLGKQNYASWNSLALAWNVWIFFIWISCEIEVSGNKNAASENISPHYVSSQTRPSGRASRRMQKSILFNTCPVQLFCKTLFFVWAARSTFGWRKIFWFFSSGLPDITTNSGATTKYIEDESLRFCLSMLCSIVANFGTHPLLFFANAMTNYYMFTNQVC